MGRGGPRVECSKVGSLIGGREELSEGGIGGEALYSGSSRDLSRLSIDSPRRVGEPCVAVAVSVVATVWSSAVVGGLSFFLARFLFLAMTGFVIGSSLLGGSWCPSLYKKLISINYSCLCR